MIIDFDNVGAVGIIKDKAAHEIHQDAWSDAQNVRFNDNRVEKFGGDSEVFGSACATAHWLLHARTPSTVFWLYAGATQVYATDGTTHANITRSSTASGSYNMTANVGWNGGMFKGIGIVNNGVDAPQTWQPGLGNRLEHLRYDFSSSQSWASASFVARVMRPFGDFLVAMDLTEGATRIENRVRWSHPASAGATPLTWDDTLPAFDAGRRDLADTPAPVIDGLALRNDFIVYKTDSVYRMSFVGGNQIFKFQQVYKTFGARSRHCIQEFYGRHFVFGYDGIVVHDLQNDLQLLPKRFQRFLDQNADADNFEKSFVVPNYPRNEMWACFPQSGQSFPSIALIWNWIEDTFTLRELTDATFIGVGIVDPQVSSTFDSQSGSFDTDSGPFDESTFNPTSTRLLMSDLSKRLLLVDEGNVFANSGDMTAYAERQSLPIGRQDSRGKIHVDISKVEAITRIHPRFTGSNGTEITVKVGGQDEIGDILNFDSEETFTIGTDYKVDVHSAFRLPAIRFESTGDKAWKLDGFKVEFHTLGYR